MKLFLSAVSIIQISDAVTAKFSLVVVCPSDDSVDRITDLIAGQVIEGLFLVSADAGLTSSSIDSNIQWRVGSIKKVNGPLTIYTINLEPIQ